MINKNDGVRPEEGTPKATTQAANEATKDPRSDKPRKVISWLKSCDSEKTLETLKSHSTEELNEILKLLNKLQERTNLALDQRADEDLKKALEERSKAEAELANKTKIVEELTARVEAKRRSAEQQ